MSEGFEDTVTKIGSLDLKDIDGKKMSADEIRGFALVYDALTHEVWQNYGSAFLGEGYLDLDPTSDQGKLVVEHFLPVYQALRNADISPEDIRQKYMPLIIQDNQAEIGSGEALYEYDLSVNIAELKKIVEETDRKYTKLYATPLSEEINEYQPAVSVQPSAPLAGEAANEGQPYNETILTAPADKTEYNNEAPLISTSPDNEQKNPTGLDEVMQWLQSYPPLIAQNSEIARRAAEISPEFAVFITDAFPDDKAAADDFLAALYTQKSGIAFTRIASDFAVLKQSTDPNINVLLTDWATSTAAGTEGFLDFYRDAFQIVNADAGGQSISSNAKALIANIQVTPESEVVAITGSTQPLGYYSITASKDYSDEKPGQDVLSLNKLHMGIPGANIGGGSINTTGYISIYAGDIYENPESANSKFTHHISGDGGVMIYDSSIANWVLLDSNGSGFDLSIINSTVNGLAVIGQKYQDLTLDLATVNGPLLIFDKTIINLSNDTRFNEGILLGNQVFKIDYLALADQHIEPLYSQLQEAVRAGDPKILVDYLDQNPDTEKAVQTYTSSRSAEDIFSRLQNLDTLLDNHDIPPNEKAAYRTFLTRYELSITEAEASKNPISTAVMLRRAKEFLNAFPDATPDMLNDPIVSEALISTKFQPIKEFTTSLEDGTGTLPHLMELGRQTQLLTVFTKHGLNLEGQAACKQLMQDLNLTSASDADKIIRVAKEASTFFGIESAENPFSEETQLYIKLFPDHINIVPRGFVIVEVLKTFNGDAVNSLTFLQELKAKIGSEGIEDIYGQAIMSDPRTMQPENSNTSRLENAVLEGTDAVVRLFPELNPQLKPLRDIISTANPATSVGLFMVNLRTLMGDDGLLALANKIAEYPDNPQLEKLKNAVTENPIAVAKFHTIADEILETHSESHSNELTEYSAAEAPADPIFGQNRQFLPIVRY